MKYIAIIAVLALLLLMVGCVMKTSLQASDAAPGESAEPTELSEDLTALDEELAVEEIEIDTAELEALDM